jgi:hypothetical protein
MLNKDSLVLGDANDSRLQNIVRVLAVFGDLLSNAKIYNDSVKNKIKEYILRINSDELFKSHIQSIWGALNDKQRNNLTNLANS